MSAKERFAADWLRLRESADHQARSLELTRHAAAWLHLRAPHQRASSERALSLVDLASGSGSNPAFLAARLPGPQRWRLVDHDAELMAQASSRLHRLVDDTGRPIEWICDHHTLTPFTASLLDGADLVCASALFDLVSREWLEALVRACVERRLAALFTISITGDWIFVDAREQPCEDTDDAWVRANLKKHQQRDKGFGEALGGDAGEALATAFTAHGYAVTSALSPWQLPAGKADSQALAVALLAGWVAALREQCPDAIQRLEAWQTRRREALESSRLGLHVTHIDLFAQPWQVHP